MAEPAVSPQGTDHDVGRFDAHRRAHIARNAINVRRFRNSSVPSETFFLRRRSLLTTLYLRGSNFARSRVISLDSRTWLAQDQFGRSLPSNFSASRDVCRGKRV